MGIKLVNLIINIKEQANNKIIITKWRILNDQIFFLVILMRDLFFFCFFVDGRGQFL